MIERHGRSRANGEAGNVAHGLLKDFGLTDGAVASSVGHDSHNVIVAGRSEADMRAALAEIERHQGGVCVVRGGEVVASVPLPVAGLLSDERVTVVAERMSALKEHWREAGCIIPFMGFNLIPLSVIPEIRLTDKGLVTVPGWHGAVAAVRGGVGAGVGMMIGPLRRAARATSPPGRGRRGHAARARAVRVARTDLDEAPRTVRPAANDQRGTLSSPARGEVAARRS